MPPGSPGIFRRRKSSTYEAAHNCLVFEQNSVKMSENSSEAPQEVSLSQANPVTPWPNCKDDYELKEIIGMIFIHDDLTFVVIFF